jgi:hypothetical protein
LKNYQGNIDSSLFLKNKMGGGRYFKLNTSEIYKRFFAIFFTIILLSFIFVPTINPQDIMLIDNPEISSPNFHNNIFNNTPVYIVDKKHEELSILPGTRFCVDRTIDGLENTDLIFVPMFSDALILESIEISNNKENLSELYNYYDCDINFNVFDAGKASCKKEHQIEF